MGNVSEHMRYRVLLLLAVFTFPLLVKSTHFHHYNHDSAHYGTGKYIHEFHEKCAVCNYEFSVFYPGEEFEDSLQLEPPYINIQCILPVHFPGTLPYTFLLRSPPSLI